MFGRSIVESLSEAQSRHAAQEVAAPAFRPMLAIDVGRSKLFRNSRRLIRYSILAEITGSRDPLLGEASMNLPSAYIVPLLLAGGCLWWVMGVDGDDATDVCSSKSLRLIRRRFRIPVTDPFFLSAATL